MVGQYVGAKVGEEVGSAVGSQVEDSANDMMNDSQSQDEEKPKKKGGACSGGAGKGDSSSDSAEYPSGGDPEKDLGEEGIEDVDASINRMCKKIYTVYRAIPKSSSCPITYRDNVSDQFTPQDDLLTMEKTCRDFLKLEGKIYDP